MKDRIEMKSRVLLLLSALVMIPVFFVPIWEIWMWAPQYPEGLTMYLWIDNISGDVDIINGLNHYIGMKYIKVEMFPEFAFMKYILMGIIGFGLLAFAVNKKILMWAFLAILILAGLAGMADFYYWGLDYGSNLDPKAAIKVPGMVYQPPLLGSKELLNFIAYSGPVTGGYLLGVGGLMTVIAIFLDLKKPKISKESNS